MSFGFQDKTLVCRDCGESFVFTAGEQRFYADKGFTNEPTRCPSCRQLHRSRRNSRQEGSGGYRGRDNRDREPRGERQLYPAICSDCGRETMVPFVPREDRPVYCSDCYRAHRQFSPRGY